MTDYTHYQSPFSWRYASDEMRSIWSEQHKRILWRRIWLALARIQSEYELVTPAQVQELADHVEEIDMPTALQIESRIHHDLMAELKTYAAQCPHAGGILHLGATSMDIEDNADALRLRQSIFLILQKLETLLLAFAQKIEETATIPIIAFTHIQPAEPSTLGYRLSIYAQDLLEDWQTLKQLHAALRGKGFKGAVGTGAAYADLIGLQNLPDFEARLSAALDLPFFPVTTQTYPRKQDYAILSALAGLAASLHKFAFDLRLLQSPPIGELSEPFSATQVGSSAMPFKRNPINAEKIDSLARQLCAYPQIAWHNAASSLLERTLDDSANRRTLLPEAFLLSDEMLQVASRLVKGLQINLPVIQRNLEIYAPFACTERILMAAAKSGADRQEMHERLRDHAMSAWQAVQSGQPNPLIPALQSDPEITRWVPPLQIEHLSQVNTYTGLAPSSSLSMAIHIRETVQNNTIPS